VEELKLEGVRSPYLSKKKRLKLHAAREKIRFKYHVIRCHWETWNDVCFDYERWAKGKFKKPFD
jgi:hypothetical protein